MIDVHACLGHFAFRQLRHNTADALLGLMDRHKIDVACVSSAAAITYRNPQEANEELLAETRRHRDRLLPFAVFNPAYAGWRDDLQFCRDQGIRGLRLYPRWHNYKLTDPDCLDLVRNAQLPVSIPIRVEDRRQQSWLVDIPDVSHEEIAALIRSAPRARFILSNGSGYSGSLLGRAANGLPPNYSIDISLLTAELQNELAQLLQTLGPERLVFGTGMPFHYPGPALVKLEILEASAAVKQQIAHANAVRILGL